MGASPARLELLDAGLTQSGIRTGRKRLVGEQGVLGVAAGDQRTVGLAQTSYSIRKRTFPIETQRDQRLSSSSNFAGAW